MSYSQAAYLVRDSFKKISEEIITNSFEKALCDESLIDELSNSLDLMNLDDDMDADNSIRINIRVFHKLSHK